MTTLNVESAPWSRRSDDWPTVAVLVIAWSAEEPQRIGEVAVLAPTAEAQVLGRGDPPDSARGTRLRFFRQRPGVFEPAPALQGSGISREQLAFHTVDDGFEVEQVGRCDLRVGGGDCERALLVPGDTIYLRGQLLLLYLRRDAAIPALRHFPREAMRDFGEPDAAGILGESPAAWHLRESVAFVARAGTHVLLTGPSGTGKELAARAVHALSRRDSRPLVARNAATLPPGLVDAELFGNVRNYPNAGMPERPGLIGQADGGSLFLDEIGELPSELQAHLLRVLDGGGEYQRLGEAHTRRSDLVLLAATNRAPDSLKHDLLARLTSRIELPPLENRREDVPLLLRHLALRAADRNPDLATRFVSVDAHGRRAVRIAPGFVEACLRGTFPGNTRDLDVLLWQSMRESPDDVLLPPRQLVLPPTEPDAAAPAPSGPRVDDPQEEKSGEPREEPSGGAVRAALGTSDSVTAAARALGVSRYALYRLMRKHGITRDDEDND